MFLPQRGQPGGSYPMAAILDDRLRRLVAEANAGSYIPPPDPTGAKGTKVMAQKVKMPKGKEFNFGTKGAVASKYPWDEWLNGDLLLIERSDVVVDDEGNITLKDGGTKRDFEVERDAMPGKLKNAARRRYKVVQISKRDADGNKLAHEGLIIKARDMTDEERKAEDELRAVEREEAKERRAAKRAGDSTDGTAAQAADVQAA